MATTAVGIFLAALVPAAAAAADSRAVEFFETKIRPVLTTKCGACHGAANPQSGLRVDSREALVKGGSRGTAIVEGDPDASLLFRAITHAEGAPAMPQGSRLNGTEIEAFREWIRLGAPYPAAITSNAYASGIDFVKGRQFWAFQPVKDYPAPKVRRRSWVRSPVDAFLLSALEKRGLAPSAEADRRTLIRRVTFDLTGLPPTPKEVADFLADRSAGAFERVVNRLLESPHYGERWARHWLDLARFAETSGHEFDSEKPDAWRYRDYVIRAFNEDLPYDQFVRENIAGDLIPRPRLTAGGTRWESPVGSGFFALHEERNAADDLAEVQVEKVDNQIDVLSKTFLGLTVACARCHDHKFDPIASADYYALAGVMHSTRQMEVMLDSPAARGEIDATHARIKSANQRLAEVLGPTRQRAAGNFAERLLQPSPEWRTALDRASQDPGDVLHSFAVLSQPSDEPFRDRMAALRGKLGELATRTQERNDVGFADFRQGSYEGWEVNGSAFGTEPPTMVPPNQAVAGWRGGGLANSFGGGSKALMGVLTSRSFVVDKPFLHVRMAGTPDKTRRREHGVLRFTLQVAGRPAFVNADKEGIFEWKTVRLNQQQGQRCYFVIADRATDGYLAVEKIVLSDSREPPVLDRPLNRYVAAILSDDSIDSPESLAAAYGRAFQQAAQGQEPDLDTQWLLASLSPTGTLEELTAVLDEAAQAEVGNLKSTRAAAETKLPASNYGVVSRDDYPHDVPLLIRGHLANPGPVVPRRFLQVLAGDTSQGFQQGSGRAELAEAIASPDNPLTARVMVNRIWKHHFGEGIVRSPDNFGLTGTRPTHPELLDYLARRFIESGWSVKAMHRMMALSSAYRMSSRPVAASAKADPENTLLHHFPVRRLEAEEVRDSILAVTGTLDRTLYGPGVPPHISPYQDGRGKPPTGPLDGNGRRSIYLQVRRNFLTPLLLAFDYPLPTTTVGRRTTTTVPSQALMLMNNEFVADQAVRWAARTIADSDAAPAKIARMFEEAYARPATKKEIASVEAFLAAQTGLNGGDTAKAWADVAHVIFNSKEFLFVR